MNARAGSGIWSVLTESGHDARKGIAQCSSSSSGSSTTLMLQLGCRLLYRTVLYYTLQLYTIPHYPIVYYTMLCSPSLKVVHPKERTKQQYGVSCTHLIRMYSPCSSTMLCKLLYHTTYCTTLYYCTTTVPRDTALNSTITVLYHVLPPLCSETLGPVCLQDVAAGEWGEAKNPFQISGSGAPNKWDQEIPFRSLVLASLVSWIFKWRVWETRRGLAGCMGRVPNESKFRNPCRSLVWVIITSIEFFNERYGSPDGVGLDLLDAQGLQARQHQEPFSDPCFESFLIQWYVNEYNGNIIWSVLTKWRAT